MWHNPENDLHLLIHTHHNSQVSTYTPYRKNYKNKEAMKTKTQTIFMHMEIKSSHFADFSMSVKIMHKMEMETWSSKRDVKIL